MQQPEPLIQLVKVSKAYEEAGQRRVILDAVSANFVRGEFVVLLGKSGSGKSTLLNLLGGIDQPSGGDVLVDGNVINRMSDDARTIYRRNHVGFIFQAFNLIPTLSAIENVSLSLELRRMPQRECRDRARAMLDKVGLLQRADTFPDRLSGGEQQRIAIARALVGDPTLVLADEPTGNLDDDTGRIILNLLDSLTRGAGKNLVMVTHSEEVVGLADRVFRLRDGKMIADSRN